MSLKANLVASYIAQIYVGLAGVITLPIYLVYMGAEAYGLVGFFSLLQAWFLLLDIGLTPTIGRETARFRGGTVDALTYRRLIRILEAIFLAVGFVACGLLVAGAGAISTEWLQVQTLPMDEVVLALQLIGVIVALRWMAGLYRSVINGAERLVWLSGFTIAVATLRFIGVLPVIVYFESSPTAFFLYQLAIALMEFAGLLIYAQRLLPRVSDPIGWHWRALAAVLPFSLTIAFTSAVWIIVTQTDKLVLSRILLLADYGYFSLAVLVASVVLIFSGPVASVIMPAMSRLEAERRLDEVIRVYRGATQLVAVLASSGAVVLAVWAEPLLWAWTGDQALAVKAAPVLRLYAVGNGILALAGFPYYLQYAKGNLRLHLIGNGIFVVLLVPLIVWAADTYGSIGAGWVWLGLNALTFATWLPFVHRRFAPGLNLKWYFEDVVPIAGAAVFVGVVAGLLLPTDGSRVIQLALIAAGGTLSFIAALGASSEARRRIRTILGKRSS